MHFSNSRIVKRIVNNILTWSSFELDYIVRYVVSKCQAASKMVFGNESEIFTVDIDHPEVVGFCENFVVRELETLWIIKPSEVAADLLDLNIDSSPLEYCGLQ